MTAREDPDRDLVEAFLETGSTEAFERLYSRYSQKVFGTAWQITGNGAEAADVTQEVFLRVFRKLRSFRFRSSFSSWLYRLTVNLATDMRRKAQVRRSDSLANMPDPVAGHVSRLGTSREQQPDVIYAREETSDRVVEVIGRLSDRTAVVLRYLQDLSYAQIAEVLEVPVGTVKSRLNRAHKRLAELLSDLAEGP